MSLLRLLLAVFPYLDHRGSLPDGAPHGYRF